MNNLNLTNLSIEGFEIKIPRIEKKISFNERNHELVKIINLINLNLIIFLNFKSNFQLSIISGCHL